MGIGCRYGARVRTIKSVGTGVRAWFPASANDSGRTFSAGSHADVGSPPLCGRAITASGLSSFSSYMAPLTYNM